MTTTLEQELSEVAPAAGQDPKRFRALAVIAVAQLMVVLDASVVIIALPSAQRSLHISVANRQWMLTAYTLAFAGLLLLGGRIADYLGRKRMFIISLIGFAAASALGGLAPNSAMLFSARALQGAFAAVMAPAALSLLTVAFTEPKERARAFAVYGGIAGGGAAIGLILGGALTQYASWRWTLLINVPIAIAAAVAAVRYVTESRSPARHGYDIPGAISVTGGLLALVYGFTKAGLDGWASSTTLELFVIAGVFLTAFVLIERRAAHPLLPLRIVLHPSRGGAFLSSLLVGIAMLGTFLSLTYYFQGTLHYSAMKSGFAFVPFSLGIITGATLASRFLPRFGPRIVMMGGLTMGALGLALFSTINVHSVYTGSVLPAELIVSLGMGLSFVAMNSTALAGVHPEDAGVASALANATQQTGSSLGAALINTIATSATVSYLAVHGHTPAAIAAGAVHGYTTAFIFSAIVLATAAVVAFSLIRTPKNPLNELDERAELSGSVVLDGGAQPAPAHLLGERVLVPVVEGHFADEGAGGTFELEGA
jgi:EmrB/QacA subfamily drug resistance transporter